MELPSGLHDANDVTTANGAYSADIVIVGAGAAGIVLAHALKDTGKTIVVLEGSRAGQGPDDRPFEDRVAQQFCDGLLTSDAEVASKTFLAASRVRAFGGTTNLWDGWTRPLSQVDLDRSELQPHYKWPLKQSVLDGLYNRALRYCSFSSDWTVEKYNDLAACKKLAPALQDFPLPSGSEIETVVDLQVYGARPDTRDRCLLNFQDAWGGAIEHAPKMTILRNASVRFLVANEQRGHVQSVKAMTINGDFEKGHEFSVSAGRYVLAAGAIETARLLLASNRLGDSRVDGNAYCRYLFTPPVRKKAATFKTNWAKGISPSLITSYWPGTVDMANPHPATVRCVLVPRPERIKQTRVGNFCAWIDLQKGELDLAWEQFPDSRNGIVLDVTRDRLFEDQRASVAISLNTQRDRDTLFIALLWLRQALEGSGYIISGSFESAAADHLSTTIAHLPGEHVMGGARMSAVGDLKSGVVDPDCRVHTVDNLYIAGNAVLPTGGCVPPTLTSIALALGLADHLKSRLA